MSYKSKLHRLCFIIFLITILISGCNKNSSECQSETLEELVEVWSTEEMTTSEEPKVEIEEKSKMNHDYKIKNNAAKNAMLENTFDEIIEKTSE